VAAGNPGRAFSEAAMTTQRLVLTPLRVEDAGQMAMVLGDVRLHEFIGGTPASPAELTARYSRMVAGSGNPGEIWLNWVACLRESREPVGTVQATLTRQGGRWAAVVAWVVGVPWQGRGYAAEAADALVTWLISQGVAVVTATIRPDHRASAAVATRAGLTPTSDEVDGERVWRREPDNPLPPENYLEHNPAHGP
jgi:RimJ/RimL family protein N-acetyltransferase